MARTSSYASRTTPVSASTAVSAFASNPGMAPVAISDTTSNVGKYLDGLQGLAAAGKITSISLSDTGIAFTYSEADIVALNAMGFAMGTEAAAPTGTAGDGTVINPMAGSSAAHMAFETPTAAQAAYEPAPWDISADLFGANPMAAFEEAPTASFGMPDWRMASVGESWMTGGSEHF